MKQTLVYDIGENRYINLTNSCTLKCRFCPKTQNNPIVHQYNLGLDKNPSASEYIDLIGDPKQFNEIVFCGFGEPTMRIEVLLEIAEFVKQNGGRTRLNTDGLANHLHKRNVLADMEGLIDAVSVSMNAQSENVYKKHCQPSLEGSFKAMLDFLKMAPEYIPEVTATAIEGLEDVDVDKCREIAEGLGVSFRKRYLDVVG
ncbi:MAG: radical SAM protein [Gammaproteobacteria bacterium]|nr:MAG: radical SAM protein [Gammaproteobacteria bacterium]